MTTGRASTFRSIAGERFDEDGDLTDPETKDEVGDLVVSLAAWTRRLLVAHDEAVAS
jgi:hypothetical protein